MIDYCYIISTLLIVLFLENISVKIFKKFVKKKYCISYKYIFQFCLSIYLFRTNSIDKW